MKRKITSFRRVAAALVIAAAVLLPFSALTACGEQCPTEDQRAYFRSLGEILDSFSNSNNEFGRIMGELSEPKNIVDEQWRQRLRQALNHLNDDAAKLAEHAPTPRIEHIHILEEQMAASIRVATDVFWQGVLRIDPNLLDERLAVLVEVGNDLESMTGAMREFCD